MDICHKVASVLWWLLWAECKLSLILSIRMYLTYWWSSLGQVEGLQDWHFSYHIYGVLSLRMQKPSSMTRQATQHQWGGKWEAKSLSRCSSWANTFQRIGFDHNYPMWSYSSSLWLGHWHSPDLCVCMLSSSLSFGFSWAAHHVDFNKES